MLETFRPGAFNEFASSLPFKLVYIRYYHGLKPKAQRYGEAGPLSDVTELVGSRI